MSWDTDASVAVIERWLEVAPAEEDAESVLARVLAELDVTPQRRAWPLPSVSGFVAIGVAAAAVAAAVIIGLAALPGSWSGSGPGHSARPGATSVPTPTHDTTPGPAAIFGIAPEGATPTDPSPAELLLSLESTITGSGTTLRIYEDGRVLRMRLFDASISPASSGFVERHLTPDGIDHVRSIVLETGLFDHDLVLSRETSFFDLTLRYDGRPVRVVWARTVDWGLGPAREATPEEAQALTELDRQLQQPDGLPAWVWADSERVYVPALNAVCLRSLPLPTSPTHLWEGLPDDVVSFVTAADHSPRDGSGNASCAWLTIDDTHELVRLLDRAGLERAPQSVRHSWLRYELRDWTVPGNEIWIMFGPVLPDGEVMILGPG
jgi:hypothetical protein